MGRTVGELLNSMTSAELGEWQAFYAIEPFGELQDDIRAGQVCTSVLAAHGARNVSPERIFPSIAANLPQQDPAMIFGMLLDFASRKSNA